MKNFIGFKLFLFYLICHGSTTPLSLLSYSINPQQMRDERIYQSRGGLLDGSDYSNRENTEFSPQAIHRLHEERLEQPIKLRNGKHPFSNSDRAPFFDINPNEDEKINFERMFANDEDNNENNRKVDMLDEGIWLDSPIDIKSFKRPPKRNSFKRTLGRFNTFAY